MTCSFLSLGDHPQLIPRAAAWFHEKWQIPEKTYLDSMHASLGASIPTWYLVIEGDFISTGHIIAGAGVIENDFHDRRDLSPNLCALYVEEDYRGRGIARSLLDFVCSDMRDHGYATLYLLTDHTDFYEKCGWEYLCTVQGDGEDHLSRMYVHTFTKESL